MALEEKPKSVKLWREIILTLMGWGKTTVSGREVRRGETAANETSYGGCHYSKGVDGNLGYTSEVLVTFVKWEG